MNYAETCDRYLKPHLGQVRLERLTPAHVQKLLRSLEQQGKTPSTRAQAHRILSRALNVAVRWELLTRNPATSVRAPRVVTRERPFLKEPELQKFVRALHGERLQALYLVALSLGLRRGELLGLKWEDIDFGRKTVTIRCALVRAGNEIVETVPKTRDRERV